MDYNDRNSKRRAQSISEMLNSGSPSSSGSRRDVLKSGYTGPKTVRNDVHVPTPSRRTMIDEDYDNDAYAASAKKVGGSGSVFMSGSISDYIWIVYVAVLAICLVLCMIIYASSVSENKKNIAFSPVPYFTGIIPALEETASTGISSSFFGRVSDNSGSEDSDDPVSTESITTDGKSVIATSNAPDKDSAITTTGSAMILDSGQGMEGYTSATSHAELLNQIEGALASADVDFAGMKIGYLNEYGDLQGYPQSVMDYFCKYMAENGDKRSSFISQVGDETYSQKNGDAYILVLPEIKFTVNMGYDESTVSLPGFSDQVVNAGQAAVIKPLLPCMYTVTIENGAWPSPVTKDIEANIREVALTLNVQ